MNKAFRVAVIAAVLGIVQGSLFCQHLSVPVKNEAFGTVKIIGKKANVDTPIYQLVDAGEPELNTINKADVFRLLTRNDLPECGGRGCVVEITESSPKSHNTMMYGTNILGNFYPPGFYRTEKSVRYYCALILGDCGSAVPIYRYYKLGIGGLFYAYSTDDSVEIPSFTKEPMPLCYGWELQEIETEGSGTSAEVQESVIKIVKSNCTSETEPKKESMKELQLYFNEQAGGLKDHYYTTKKPSLSQLNDESNDFNGYRLMDDEIGMVITDEQKSGCSCLTRLIQMKSEKTDGFMPHRDHALISDISDIAPQNGALYDPLPEDVYCASKQGACGASLPLRKYFNLFDLDTTYTVNTTVPAPMTISTSPVLCWIWPLSETTRLAKKAAKIAATLTTMKMMTTKVPATTVDVVINATEIAPTTEKATTAVKPVAKEAKKTEKNKSNSAKQENETTETKATNTEKATIAETTEPAKSTTKTGNKAFTTAAPTTTFKVIETSTTTEKLPINATQVASRTTEAAKVTEYTIAKSAF